MRLRCSNSPQWASSPAQQKVLTGVDKIRWTVTGDASNKYAQAPVSTLIEAMFEPYVRDLNDAQFRFMSIGPGTL